MATGWTPEDRDALEAAVKALEVPSFTARATAYLGTPIERSMKLLPGGAQTVIANSTRIALDKAMTVALATLRDRSPRRASRRLHAGAVAVTGALGGAMGLPALAVELPVTTGLMLRSIADIARSEGEDLGDPACALACMEVFALGSPKTRSDNDADVGYFAVRSALALQVRHATDFVLKSGVAAEGAPALVRLIASIAARFNIVVTDKVLLQAMPVIGAAGGALVNTLFIASYQDLAHGHFTVRRLERAYDPVDVRAEYDQIRSRLGL